MAQTARDTRQISFSSDDPIRIGQTIGAALRKLGYSDIHLELDQFQVTVKYKDREQKQSHTYQYEYDCFITWLPKGEQTEVSIEVKETKSNWQIDACRERLEEIFQEIENASVRYKQTRQHLKPNTLYGDARFATKDEIDEYRPKEPGKLYLGFVQNAEVSVPEKQAQRHTLVCGPTGSGKTWSMFIPNLIFKTDTSAVVTEARSGSEEGHLYFHTAGHREAQGQKIFHFDPEHRWSTRINPVDQAQDPLTATHVASLIMENTSLDSHVGDQIWETSERLLLSALVLDANTRNEHLGYVRWLLREGPTGIGLKLKESPSGLARREYASFLNNSLEGFRAGVVAGLMQRLNLWTIPEVVALTEKSDFEAEELHKERFTFYLSTLADRSQYAPLMALVFNYVLSVALSDERSHPLMLFLDEFVNYGRIPNMTKKLTMIRHSEVGAVLGIQDYLQLEELYGDKRAKILFGQPATRVFFKPNDLRTAEEISKLLGKKTAEEVTINNRCEIHTRRFERFLLTPQEVLGLDQSQLIARLPDLKYPILMNRIPIERFEAKTRTPPPERPEHPVKDEHLGPEPSPQNWHMQARQQNEKWARMSEQEKQKAFRDEKGVQFNKGGESKPETQSVDSSQSQAGRKNLSFE